MSGATFSQTALQLEDPFDIGIREVRLKTSIPLITNSTNDENGLNPHYSQPSFTRPKPPHQYPSVKGTQNNLRFPPHRMEQTGPLPGITYSASTGRVSSQRLSQETKAALTQNLHHVYDTERISSRERSNTTISRYPGSTTPPMTSLGTLMTTSFPDEKRPNPYSSMYMDYGSLEPTHVSSMALGGTKETSEGISKLLGGKIPPRNKYLRAEEEEAIDTWWITDRRVDWRTRSQCQMLLARIREELIGSISRPVPEDFSSTSYTRSFKPKTPSNTAAHKDLAFHLLLPVLMNLKTYENGERDYFNKHAPAPAWCIDPSATGNQSFFGGDWGAPPPRVGRDPRYRHVQQQQQSFGDFGVPNWPAHDGLGYRRR